MRSEKTKHCWNKERYKQSKVAMKRNMIIQLTCQIPKWSLKVNNWTYRIFSPSSFTGNMTEAFSVFQQFYPPLWGWIYRKVRAKSHHRLANRHCQLFFGQRGKERQTWLGSVMSHCNFFMFIYGFCYKSIIITSEIFLYFQRSLHSETVLKNIMVAQIETSTPNHRGGKKWERCWRLRGAGKRQLHLNYIFSRSERVIFKLIMMSCRVELSVFISTRRPRL